MLRAHGRRFLLAVSVALVAAIGAPLSSSAAPPGCRELVMPDGTIFVDCSRPGAEPDPGGGHGGGGGSATCHFGLAEIPCTTEFGTWNGRCYTRLALREFPFGDPVWENRTDGVIVECTPHPCLTAANVETCEGHSYYRSDSAPAGGPSPRELAERAVAQMRLTMGDLGSTPPSTSTDSTSLGAIGLPLWFWVANPAENTTGPITRSASDGGLTVTATGTLDRTVWTLTEQSTGIARATVTCRGANAGGTPYDGRDNASPSPTCGIPANLNQHPGAYTLTATAYWTVEWAGGGQTDTINITPPPNSVPLTIGELQVLVSR